MGNMPKAGDVMIKADDKTLGACGEFTAVGQGLDHPGKLAAGYTPIAYIRTGRCPCRMKSINWKMGKETGGAKVEGPQYVKKNEVAEIVFTPQAPFVADTFKSCEGLGRVAIMEGNGVVMLGKISGVEFKADEKK